MTCEPFMSRYQIGAQPGTLVLVDMSRRHLEKVEGLSRSPVATILANCRLALGTARGRGWNVAFVSGDGSGSNYALEGGWVRGFEPTRQDAVIERRTLSCYSSPYFAGAIESNGTHAVIAGFLGEGGCLATGVDAIRAKQHLTFLTDAIKDRVSETIFDGGTMPLLKQYTAVEITSLPCAAWARDAAIKRISPSNQPLGY